MYLSAGLGVAAFLLSGALLLTAIALTPPAVLVAARSLMFSHFISDESLTETDVNAILGANDAFIADSAGYRRFINPRVLTELISYAGQNPERDTALAREVAQRMSAGRPLGGCGEAEPLSDKVRMVAQRFGCCSDYVVAFQVYAAALGLPTRRVENETHTSVEYFDRQIGHWIWLDAMYRAQAIDRAGHLLSHFEIRDDLLRHQAVHFIELFDAPMRSNTYQQLYDAKHYTMAYWYPPTDLLTIEQADARLRAFNIPRPIRQFFALLTGVRAKPIAVAPSGVVLGLQVGAVMAWVALAMLVVAELVLASVATVRFFRLVRVLLLPDRTAEVISRRLDRDEGLD
jgi:hypothetical protein